MNLALKQLLNANATSSMEDILTVFQHMEEKMIERGHRVNSNPAAALAEEMLAAALTSLTGQSNVVELSKGYDVRNHVTGELIEAKSTVSSNRSVGGLKDKGTSDKIAVIHYVANDKTRIESAIIYPTNVIMQNRTTKKMNLTAKVQREIKHLGLDITEAMNEQLSNI
jgi:hypothetical protein